MCSYELIHKINYVSLPHFLLVPGQSYLTSRHQQVLCSIRSQICVLSPFLIERVYSKAYNYLSMHDASASTHPKLKSSFLPNQFLHLLSSSHEHHHIFCFSGYKAEHLNMPPLSFYTQSLTDP